MATSVPQNRAAFALDEVARATAGAVYGAGSSCVGVSTDTRSVAKGSLFVALAGDRFDGHDFLGAAVDAGAVMLLVHRDPDMAEIEARARRAGMSVPAIVRVQNTRLALGQLASAHRKRWAEKGHEDGARAVLGITGSAGKTTTRIVITKLLEVAVPGQVLSTQGNLNNDIGMPMTLLGAAPEHRFVVLEMGTSRRGEMALLAGIALPNAAVLTLVAAAHSEGIGTIDDVATEKGDLFSALPSDGIAIVNADDPRASGQLLRTRARRQVTYGFGEGASYRIASYRSLGTEGIEARLERPFGVLELKLPLLGRSGALAAAAAVGASEALLDRPLSRDEAARAFADWAGGAEGRLTLLRLPDGTLLIDDTYNANPASMRSSIAAACELAQHEHRRLVLVLGEMRELGPIAESEHEALGIFAGTSEAAFVLGVSGHALSLVKSARAQGRSAEFAPDLHEALTRLEHARRPGDVVLVKGSRSVGTDQLVRKLLVVADADDEGKDGARKITMPEGGRP